MNELRIKGRELGAFWHCFGTENHRASLALIIDLLNASRTRVLPINTHRLGKDKSRDHLEHGFSRISYDELAANFDVGALTAMINVNLRTSAAAAVEVAKRAVEMTGESVLKLEVLTPDLKNSNDEAVLDAAARLYAWKPDLVILPLLRNDVHSAREAAHVGCPLIRVMGSPIGSRRGIEDEAEFVRVVDVDLPVVLDGGVGEVEHVRRAAELGARGVLVNSVLFDSVGGPIRTMREMREAAEQVF